LSGRHKRNTRQCNVHIALRSDHATIVAVDKKKNITESECVSVALGFHHENSMRYIVTCGLSCSTRFSTLSHKRHDFRNTVLEYKMCVFEFSVQLLSETFLFLKRIERDIVINVRVHPSSCTVPVFFSYFSKTCIFS